MRKMFTVLFVCALAGTADAQDSLTFNYDDRPAEGASNTDYVCQTTFGWTW